MKRLILSISIFALFVASFAQTNRTTHSKMLEGNPIWEYYSCHCNWKTITNEVTGEISLQADPQVTFYCYYLDGNITSNGKSYKKLCRRTISPEGVMSSSSFVCGIREYEGKIIVNKYHIDGDYGVKPSYMLECQFPPYSWDEEILLDFSLRPGQKLYSSYYYTKDDSVYFKAVSDEEIILEDGSRSYMHNVQHVYKNKYDDSSSNMIGAFLKSIDDIGYLNKFLPFPAIVR